jgi:hypothetical protein
MTAVVGASQLLHLHLSEAQDPAECVIPMACVWDALLSRECQIRRVKPRVTVRMAGSAGKRTDSCGATCRQPLTGQVMPSYF